MRSFLSIIAAPALCLGVLGGITWERGRHATVEDAAGFHSAAKASIEGWPKQIGDWVGTDVEVPQAAVKLLNPNALLSRRYYNPKEIWRSPVDLLVVQCSKPEDMSGHYPPVCYPNNGKPLLGERRRSWTVPGVAQPIEGMEYTFDEGFDAGIISRKSRIVVYNFFVLPGRGIVPDMAPVRQASGDYQRKHFGSAQIQVIFRESGDGDPVWRDAVFTQLIASNSGVIATLARPK